MIRTLETACNNNISHPSLLHKPFLFLDQAFLYGCILSPKAMEITPKAWEIKQTERKPLTLRRERFRDMGKNF